MSPRPPSTCDDDRKALPLTARQQEILDWIRRQLEATGMPPTRAEIAAGLGFQHRQLGRGPPARVGEKGRDRAHARGVARPAPHGPARAAGHGRCRSSVAWPPASPILAAEHIEAHVRLDPALFAPRADYLLRVRGLSMKDAGILDGDLLAVHRSAEARSGQIVVARLGDEVTVKRLKRRGGQVLLVAENPDFAPIVVEGGRDALAIEGIGVGLFRSGKAL